MKVYSKILAGIITVIMNSSLLAQTPKIDFLPINSDYTCLNSLWNVIIENPSELYKSGFLIGTITNSKAELMFSARSTLFSLNKGISIPTLNQIKPLILQYIHPSFSRLSSADILPYGSYVICIELYSAIENQLVSETCTEIDITIQNPPQLVSPGDADSIKETQPIFTWIPPSPIRSNKKVLYDFRLVEIKGNQSAESAYFVNQAIFNVDRIPMPILSYPGHGEKLEIGKSYAWSVVAYVDTKPIPAEEIWYFTVIEEPKKDKTPKLYAQVTTKLDAGFMVVDDGIMRFSYNTRYHGEIVDYQLNSKQEQRRKKDEITAVLIPMDGENLYEIDLRCLLKETGHYTLELVNSKKVKFYLKFYYDKESPKNEGCL